MNTIPYDIGDKLIILPSFGGYGNPSILFGEIVEVTRFYFRRYGGGYELTATPLKKELLRYLDDKDIANDNREIITLLPGEFIPCTVQRILE